MKKTRFLLLCLWFVYPHRGRNQRCQGKTSAPLYFVDGHSSMVFAAAQPPPLPLPLLLLLV